MGTIPEMSNEDDGMDPYQQQQQMMMQ